MRPKVIVVVVGQVAGEADEWLFVGRAFAARVTGMHALQVLLFCLFNHGLLKRLCPAVEIGPDVAKLRNRAKRRALELIQVVAEGVGALDELRSLSLDG